MFRRTRAQSISVLQPTTSRVSSSQPVPIIVQPSPKVTRSRRVLTQPTSTSPISGNCSMHEQNAAQNPNEVLTCPLCALTVTDEVNALCCDLCSTWYHAECLLIPQEEYESIGQLTEKWFCDHCSAVRANRIKWGNMKEKQYINGSNRSTRKF